MSAAPSEQPDAGETLLNNTLLSLPPDAQDPTQSVRRLGSTTVTSGTVERTLRSAGFSGMPRISVSQEIRIGGGEKQKELEVTGVLGEGGMGKVLLARQHTLQRDVAIKVLRPGAAHHHYQALVDEAAIVGSLEHPAIVPVHALGLDDEASPVMVMKRIEGATLTSLLGQPEHELWGDRREPDERLGHAIALLIQVCNAVHFAHTHHIIHLDIKPDNILAGPHGDVYLVDWGVARRLEGGVTRADFAGTPIFAAPEMVTCEDLDPRTDVYLLGATLHYILTRERRHRGKNMVEVLSAAMLSEPVEYDESIPLELAKLANRATALIPDDRPQSVVEFRRALADYLEHRSSTALTASALARIAELWVLLHDSDQNTDPETGRRIDELAVEARFGLEQALELWPANSEAERAQGELESMFGERRTRDIAQRRQASVQVGGKPARAPTRWGVVLTLAGAVALLVAGWRWALGGEGLVSHTLAAALLTLAVSAATLHFARAASP